MRSAAVAAAPFADQPSASSSRGARSILRK